ncbi:MAG: FxLYD domain-containing protein [Anaerolineae bacterium]|nr:FxLYD domain-containing protein [Anaerolineae bacterium]
MKQIRKSGLVLFLGAFLLTMLVGCSGGAVVYVPTPLPPDENPQKYEHPSGAFSLVLPPNWSAYTQNLTNLASASFSPPDSRDPLITIAVINIGHEIEADELNDLRITYQTQVRPDLSRYTEHTAEALGDGAWRIVGVNHTPTGETIQVNTFIERRGSLLGVTNVRVPVEANRNAGLQQIVNTVLLGNEEAVQLEPTTLNTLALAAATGLEVVNVHTWSTAEGVFFVTGEVTNHDIVTAYDVPVKAILTRGDGTAIVEAEDNVMGYGILPGGYAPFSLRFGQGQPADAVSFSVAIGEMDTETLPTDQPALVGNPTLTWTDAVENSANGTLYIIGMVNNESDEPVRSPRATITVFDDIGRVIAAGFADVEIDVLEAGESASFNIAVPEMGGEAINYLVNVQAVACDDESC